MTLTLLYDPGQICLKWVILTALVIPPLGFPVGHDLWDPGYEIGGTI